MKKVLLLIIVLLLSGMVYAAEAECPIGLVNDTAPGQCVLYSDANTNAICDLSEPHNCTADEDVNNPENMQLTGTQLKAMTVAEVANAYNIDKELFALEIGKYLNMKVKSSDSLLLLHDNNGLGMADVKALATAVASTNVPSSNNILLSNNIPVQTRTQYYLVPIILITTLLYFITFGLVKFNKLSYMTHKKIWNWILLISFLATAVFALIWILNAEFLLGIRLPINTSFWHIETGLVMIIISVFHVWWHLNYYFVKKKKKSE